MSPNLVDFARTRIISDSVHIPAWAAQEAIRNIADIEERTLVGLALREVLREGFSGILELLYITQPEILLTRRPRMIPLGVPSPHLKIKRDDGYISTAGILCHDHLGEFGITACLHGTGPEGTPVRVGSYPSRVKRASSIQDLVFIPIEISQLRIGPMMSLVGLQGVKKDREPAKADRVYFDGATNHNCTTRIYGTDNGLLRARPTVQLKLQTEPDTDQGDSGCSLLDESDQVLGFAFERTAYDDYPQFTDWIWAANALRALNLTPIGRTLGTSLQITT
jgi:hypothetical protein